VSVGKLPPEQVVTSEKANAAIAEFSPFTAEIPDLGRFMDAVFAPIRPLMPDAQAFLDKKLGESTGAELLAFVACIAYALGVGYIGANLAVAVIRAGARGPVAVRVPLQLR
jgi:hypothetical protein